ncbi:hypothetical protein KAK05_02850, partial [Candidatus Parcubacteria bacterium]|nr:hypothetical protein [Candidatus Parcubacteria bacterium]
FEVTASSQVVFSVGWLVVPRWFSVSDLNQIFPISVLKAYIFPCRGNWFVANSQYFPYRQNKMKLQKKERVANPLLRINYYRIDPLLYK